ncbi:hypothetical protein EDL98_01270 [Ornithobacterium rhinotracheale]|uniref:hypothetical protein n=1 Tax=Ornithobacterium rhinotracheale TaxID=28251 RepID=UPI00129C3379|nr:hypothetical protein [Ornithobacterium rhinotracheale]MRJ09722.1 hypothetical protein [Ornithobacterium rhinotracheale]
MDLLLFEITKKLDIRDNYIVAPNIVEATGACPSLCISIELVDSVKVLTTKSQLRLFSVELSFADMGTDTTKLKKYVVAKNILQVAGAFPGAESIKEFAAEHDVLVVNSVN